MTALYIVLGIVVVLVIAYIAIMNSLRRATVKIDEAESGIDVALTKRYDMLTKMLDVTKAYAQHERDTLSQVIEMRKGMTMQERVAANQQMDALASRINVVAEAYPELRSSENFKQLQMAVADAEEHLQAARRLYNGNVSLYNQALVTFPKSVVANMIGLHRREFFEADAKKREDVTMEF